MAKRDHRKYHNSLHCYPVRVVFYVNHTFAYVLATICISNSPLVEKLHTQYICMQTQLCQCSTFSLVPLSYHCIIQKFCNNRISDLEGLFNQR